MKVLESASLGGAFAPNTRKRRVLFFIVGAVPTEAELAAAQTLGTKMFRNAAQVTDLDAIERCDGVAGAVPPRYAKCPRLDAPAVAAPIPAETPVITTTEAPAPAAPAVAPTVANEPTSDAVSEEDVSAFAGNSVDTIVGMVKRGEVSKERALELERRGKNRTTCIKRVSDLA